MEIDDITLLVLCGGLGRRMGGQDKPLLQWRGRSMVDHVLNSVPAGMPKLISANRNMEEYRRRADVVTDKGLPGQGPLVGVLAGLRQATTPWLLVAPGDAPELPAEGWQALLQAAQPEHHAVLQDDERQQHLHLLLRRDAAERSLTEYLSAGYFQVYLWLEELQPVKAAVSGQLMNINRPEELED